MATASGEGLDIRKLILVPAVITLAVTLLRLIGEFQQWSALFFSAAAGGGGALVGIVWLVPVFGIYFAMRLAKSGEGPEKVGRVILFPFLSILVLVAGFLIGGMISGQPGQPGSVVAAGIASILAIAVMSRPWPQLFHSLLGYGIAARIPVVVIMFFAIKGSWGTHYDGPPPGFPEMSWLSKFVIIGVLPQLTFWVAFTVIIGSLFGGIAVALFSRKKAEKPVSGYSDTGFCGQIEVLDDQRDTQREYRRNDSSPLHQNS